MGGAYTKLSVASYIKLILMQCAYIPRRCYATSDNPLNGITKVGDASDERDLDNPIYGQGDEEGMVSDDII